MLDFVIAVNDEEVLRNNFARSPGLARSDAILYLQRGYVSAGTAYNTGLAMSRGDLVVFAHQDVYLPAHWETQVLASIDHLNLVDPSWAILGLYGVTRSGQHVGHVWSSGLNRLLGHGFGNPTAVDTIDELLLIVRKSSGLRFDEDLPGFHLYATDIAQAAWEADFSTYVICAPVVHNSRPVLYLSADYLQAYNYIKKKWRHRLPIQNCIAPIVDSAPVNLRKRIRYLFDSTRFASVDRDSMNRKLDSVEIARKLGFE